MIIYKKVSFIGILLILGISLLYAQAADPGGFSRKHPIEDAPIVRDSITPDLEMSFSLSINGKPKGEINAGIWNNSAIIKKDTAANLLIDYLRPDIYSTIFDAVFKNLTWLTANDFSMIGISFVFDSAALTLSITVPPSFSPVVDLDFVPDMVPNFKPILRPAPFSGFVQNDSSVQISNLAGGFTALYSHLYSMIDIQGLHLFVNGFAAYSSDTLPTFSFSLENAYALWYSNARSLQATLGMFTTPGTSFQTQPRLFAASISSSDSYPYVIRQGLIDDTTEFTISKTARVTIEINGRAIRQVVLTPGNYRILDLPFTSGLNEYVLRIEESDGKVQVLRRMIPRENSTLVMGTSKYALSAGVSTTDLSEFLATGYYMYGFSQTFSGGFNLQFDKRSAMGGLTWIAALPFGNINGTAALVGRWDGWGNALTPQASIGYTFSMPWNESIPTLSLSALYQGAGFFAPNITAPSGTPSEAYLSAGAGIYTRVFERTGVSLSYSYAQSQGTSILRNHDFYVSISQGLSARGNLTLSGHLSLRAGEAPTFFANVGFTIQPHELYQRFVSYSQSSDGSSNMTVLDKVGIAGKLFDVSLNATNLLPGSGSDSSLNLGIRNLSDYYDISASGLFAYSESTGLFSGAGSAQFRTTMAFVGPYIGFTRQTPDSFLLIASAKNLKNLEASYTLSSGSRYFATRGQNIVVPLTSYRTTVLATTLLGAELNLDPRNPYAVVSPAFRSGLLFMSDVVKRSMILGRLVDQNSKPVSYLPGDVYDIGGSLITSTFTDETGMFNIYDLLPGSYRIQWPEGYGTTNFELIETDSDTLELGDIVVHTKAK